MKKYGYSVCLRPVVHLRRRYRHYRFNAAKIDILWCSSQLQVAQSSSQSTISCLWQSLRRITGPWCEDRQRSYRVRSHFQDRRRVFHHALPVAQCPTISVTGDFQGLVVAFFWCLGWTTATEQLFLLTFRTVNYENCSCKTVLLVNLWPHCSLCTSLDNVQ